MQTCNQSATCIALPDQSGTVSSGYLAVPGGTTFCKPAQNEYNDSIWLSNINKYNKST
jgi:hypothetical protein